MDYLSFHIQVCTFLVELSTCNSNFLKRARYGKYRWLVHVIEIVMKREIFDKFSTKSSSEFTNLQFAYLELKQPGLWLGLTN